MSDTSGVAGGDKMKFVMVGDIGVGKTTLVNTYMTGQFSDNVVPVECMRKTVTINNTPVTVEFVDSMGIETDKHQFFYIQKCIGCVFVFDRTSQESFNSLEQWYALVRRYGARDIHCVLVGNKSDETPIVNDNDVLQFAAAHQLMYSNVSAKIPDEINNTIKELIQSVFKSYHKKSKSCNML